MSEEFDMQAGLAEMADSLGFTEEIENDSGDNDPGTLDSDDAAAGTLVPATGGEGEVVPGDAGKVMAAAPAPGTAPIDPAAGPSPTAAPRTWRAEAAAEWAKVPPLVQAEITKREEDMFTGLEGYKQDAGFGKTVQKVMAPFAGILAENRIDPITHINTLMNFHHRLHTGDMSTRVGTFRQLMNDYGISVDHLTGIAEVERPNPEVQRLQQKIDRLESSVTGMTAAQQEAATAQASGVVNAFAADPKNIHFDAVSNDIVALLQSGVCKTLPEAYEKAVWSNPVTRAAEQARQQAERDEATKKAAEEKAKAARKLVGVNVRTNARDASRTTPLGSIDDGLKDTLAAIHAREK